MWLAMRGALGAQVHERHRASYLATTTNMTVLVLDSEDPIGAEAKARAETPLSQLDGVERIEGTYPFDVRLGQERSRLNRFFWNMRLPEFRDRFHADEAALCADCQLTQEETALVRARDWLGLVRYGVNFFVLEKFARLVGRSNLEVYAAMRGESFEEFLATRRVPEAR